MARILVIDDDAIFQKMIGHTLEPLGYELVYANDGLLGLTQANAIDPDMVICDVMMPVMDGYDVVRRLRRNSKFAQTPILMLTAQADLDEKLAGFEAGADDYMTKPFAPPELVARVGTLLRKVQSFKMSPQERKEKNGKIIAIHNLRGGVGSSTVAVNLAVGIAGLWAKPTILLDLVLTAGQIALMVNGTLRRTWADLGNFKPEEIDMADLQSIINHHDLGFDYIAAPTFPPEAELLTIEHFKACMQLLRKQYDYLVIDLPHDFGEISFNTLDLANNIVIVIAPEMASIRAAAAAIETYKKLEYDLDKITLVMNWIFERQGLVRKNIEVALHHSVDIILPFVPDITIEAINYGKPFLASKPAEEISEMIENLAFGMSKEEDRTVPPVNPTKAWHRTMKRLKG
jgi:pilus assembly protein CpaE